MSSLVLTSDTSFIQTIYVLYIQTIIRILNSLTTAFVKTTNISAVSDNHVSDWNA